MPSESFVQLRKGKGSKVLNDCYGDLSTVVLVSEWPWREDVKRSCSGSTREYCPEEQFGYAT